MLPSLWLPAKQARHAACRRPRLATVLSYSAADRSCRPRAVRHAGWLYQAGGGLLTRVGQVTLLSAENTQAATTSSQVAGQQHNVRQGEILHYYYLFIYPPEQSSC